MPGTGCGCGRWGGVGLGEFGGAGGGGGGGRDSGAQGERAEGTVGTKGEKRAGRRRGHTMAGSRHPGKTRQRRQGAGVRSTGHRCAWR